MTSNNSSDRSILVVDDCEAMVALLSDVFADCGSVDSAAGGFEAINALRARDYDLVVLDLHMPQPDGWSVLEFIRRLRPALLSRTILLTGDRHHRCESVRAAGQYGVRTVYKPFDVDELRRSTLAETPVASLN